MEKNTAFQFRCSESEMTAWRLSAKESGLSLSQWVRSRLVGQRRTDEVEAPVKTEKPSDNNLCPRCQRVGQNRDCPACKELAKST